VVRAKEFLRAAMTQEDSQIESGERFLAAFDLLEGQPAEAGSGILPYSSL
jgi:hypothetical protein